MSLPPLNKIIPKNSYENNEKNNCYTCVHITIIQLVVGVWSF